MIFPPFSHDTKQLRRSAIAELEVLEDIRDQWRNRPLGTYNRASERRLEDGHMRRERLARHALASTMRGYMDAPDVCEWRAKVREQIRLVRSYYAQAVGYGGNPDKTARMLDMSHYYRKRVGDWLAGYRRAIAHARPEIAP